MTIQTDNNGQPLVAALQFPVYRLSEFDWKNWTPASRFYYTQFIGIDDTATPVVYSLRYCVPGVAGGVGQVSSNTLEDFQAEIADVLSRQDKIDLDVADLLAQVNSLLTTAQDVAAQAQSSVTSAAQSATTATSASTTSQTWAEGEDTAVTELGGVHSSKVWAAQSEAHATAAHNDYISMTTDANVVAVGSNINNVNAVGQSISNVSTVAGDISSVNTVASNIAAIQDAPTAATNAANSATDSANSATASATSAQAAQDALNDVQGLIATPIGTIFQSVYVDESLDIARQLNGQLISSTKFTGFRSWLNTVQTAAPNLFTTETNWQAEKTNSKLGQCGKFVVDDTAGTIRLPAVVNAQGLVDLALIGGIKNESLPNINISSCGIGENNSMYHRTAGYPTSYLARGDGQSGLITEPFASLTSSTYQNNAPVQQEAVQYPYYIQVATGVEETLPAIREYQINTPFFFGQSMYSDVAPDNASWLASNGQYNARSVYPDYYDWLVEQMNAGVSGFVASTAAYTDYDFVVNQSDQTFRLPLLNGEEMLPNGTKRLISNDFAAGNTYYTAERNVFVTVNVHNSAHRRLWDNTIDREAWVQQSAQTKYGAGTLFIPKGHQYGVFWQGGTGTGEPRSIYEVDAVGNGTLYYYVGDTVQDASLINAGAVLGQLGDKISRTSASDKELIVGWGMPDYSAGVSKSLANGRISGKGYLLFTTKQNVGVCDITIGTTVFKIGGNYETLDTLFVPVDNNSYSCSNWSTINTLVFIPLKGIQNA